MAGGIDSLIEDAVREFAANNKDKIVKFLKEHVCIEATFKSHGELQIGLYFDGELVTSCYTYLPEELDSLAKDRRKGNI